MARIDSSFRVTTTDLEANIVVRLRAFVKDGNLGLLKMLRRILVLAHVAPAGSEAAEPGLRVKVHRLRETRLAAVGVVEEGRVHLGEGDVVEEVLAVEGLVDEDLVDPARVLHRGEGVLAHAPDDDVVVVLVLVELGQAVGGREDEVAADDGRAADEVAVAVERSDGGPVLAGRLIAAHDASLRGNSAACKDMRIDSTIDFKLIHVQPMDHVN